MTEQSTKWDTQWSVLLTHCHGEDVQVSGDFKSNLLGKLKARMAETATSDDQVKTVSESDAHWQNLLTTAYVPCHHDPVFKTSLLESLKAKQAGRTFSSAGTEPIEAPVQGATENAIRTILTKSYQPVEPHPEFQTRLLGSLKERQRDTVVLHRASRRRRTIFMSAASSIAAMALFVLWIMPTATTPITSSSSASMAGISLQLPESAMRADSEVVAFRPESVMNSGPVSGLVPVSYSPDEQPAASIVPASYDSVAVAKFASYDPSAAFDSPALPGHVFALQNIEVNDGSGWSALDQASRVAIRPGLSFRSTAGMGHIEFPDGSLMSLSPESRLDATADGLTVNRGFMLVAVPEYSEQRFRLHFPERDLAVEPGTDLAVMVENPDNYAEGGAPAPMVMVVERPGIEGGLALARGSHGIGPLFTKQLYRLDNYVTADLPGRTMYETECQDVNNLFKKEVVRQDMPMAAFAGGFSNHRDLSYTTTILTPTGFTRKGDRWVADSYNGEQTVKVKYLSNEYFGFANERRDLASAFSLGSKVVIDGGDGTFYEILK